MSKKCWLIKVWWVFNELQKVYHKHNFYDSW